jgi:hypothetical protein
MLCPTHALACFSFSFQVSHFVGFEEARGAMGHSKLVSGDQNVQVGSLGASKMLQKTFNQHRIYLP